MEDTLDYSLDAEGRKTSYIYDTELRQPNLIFVWKPTDPEVLNEIDVNGSMELDSDWSDVNSPSTNVRSTTQVDSSTYARRIVASAAGKGMESVEWDWEAHLTYLIVARVYPVSGVVKMQVTGTSAFDRVSQDTGAWETLSAIYKPNSGDTDQNLQFVSDGGAAEFYVDSVHIFELVDLLSVQEFHYDNKGRTVYEAVLNMETGIAAQQVRRTYGDSGNGNGLLESLTQVDVLHPANNISTSYSYDEAGRIVKTQQSSLFGSCVLLYTVYDAAGHVTATVCVNPEDTGTSIPTDVEEALAIYDADDPVKKANKVTTYEYDTLGRQVKRPSTMVRIIPTNRSA